MSIQSITENTVISKGDKVLANVAGVGSVKGQVIAVNPTSYEVKYVDDYGLKCVSLVTRSQLQVVYS